MRVYVHEIFDKMSAYIEQCGWAQGGPGSPTGNYGDPACLLVSMKHVCHRERNNASLYAKACGVLAQHTGYEGVMTEREIWGHIATWNDDPDRSRNQVTAMLAAASAVAKAQDQYVDVPNRLERRHDKLSVFMDFDIGYGALEKMFIDDMQKALMEKIDTVSIGYIACKMADEIGYTPGAEVLKKKAKVSCFMDEIVVEIPGGNVGIPTVDEIKKYAPKLEYVGPKEWKQFEVV